MILEVLDKFPTTTEHLVSSVLLGGVGFVACLRWPRALWIAMPFAMLVAWGVADTYLDPYMGPAVWAEGGVRFALLQAIGLCLVAVPPLLGAWLTRRHAVPVSGGTAENLEIHQRRLNSHLDIAEGVLWLLLPEWLWPTGPDVHRRAMVAFLWLLIVIALLLAVGAWLTGYLRFDAV